MKEGFTTTPDMPLPVQAPEPHSVVVVVLTFDGLSHLQTGLPAMLALDGLAGPSSIVVADNGSTDGSIDWLRAAHPDVTVIEFGENLGFAAGYDQALGRIDSEWALLLNNDTSPAPHVLRRLCEAVKAAGARNAFDPVACASARLVDWAGQRIDFDGGGMAISGHGHSLGYGSKVTDIGRSAAHPRYTLFCSGAAMLVHVPTFISLGGLDPNYFAYYEDVDFGWRLWAAGYRAIHVPTAVVHHRGGGSAATLRDGRSEWLHERNALMTVVKNVEVSLASRWIRAAIGLAAWRASKGAAGLGVIDGAALEVGLPEGDAPGLGSPEGDGPGLGSPEGDAPALGSPEGDGPGIEPTNQSAPSAEPGYLPARSWPGWRHLEALALDLDALITERGKVQALRKRSDSEIIELMHFPWAPVPASIAGWAALRRAARVFGLEEIFGPFVGGRWGGPSKLSGRLVETLLHVIDPAEVVIAMDSAAPSLNTDDSGAHLAESPSERSQGRLADQGLDHRIELDRPAVYGDPVDVILVAYEGRAFLEKCLPALAAQDYKKMNFFVADNGSCDGTVAWLRDNWSDVEVLALGQNFGFAEANNRAIAAGEAPWVALVNTDTLPEKGWLSALIRAADGRPEVGAVASRMLFMDRPDVVQSAGIAVDPSGIAWDRLGGAPAHAAAEPATVFGASAGAALFRRVALEDVAEGGNVFDPRFFMYLEDVDLAWRLRLRGWDAAYAPDATILHEGSATSGEGSAFKNRLLARNKVWTVAKCYPARGLAFYGPLILAYDLASVPYRFVFAGQSAALRGRFDALAGLGGVIVQRRLIQAGRRAEWPALEAAMEPVASPLGVLRRYRHLRRSAGVVGPRG